MSDDLDAWINACGDLEGVSSLVPNPKPLAALLRSGKPVPPGICDQLAEMLDPGEPPLTKVRLVPQLLETERKQREHFSKTQAALTYKICKAKGASAKEALEEARKCHNIKDESNFYHSLNDLVACWSNLINRVRGG